MKPMLANPLKADLDRARTKHGLAPGDLAMLLGVSPRQLAGIERESERPPADLQPRLQKLLATSDLTALKLRATGSVIWPWTQTIRYVLLGFLGAGLYWTGRALQTSPVLAVSLQVVGGVMILVFAVKGRKLTPQCSRCGSRAGIPVACAHCGASFVPAICTAEGE